VVVLKTNHRFCDGECGGLAMAGQPGLFDGEERLAALSAAAIRWNG
jgi:hypothetical protein